MEKFSTIFSLKLCHLIFAGTKHLQGKDTTVKEATVAAELAVCYLEWQRIDEAFHSFYKKAVEDSKELTASPILPRYCPPSKKWM